MARRSAEARTAVGAGALASLVGFVMVLAACGGGRSTVASTPTPILQPTPDRTVDAVIRGATRVFPVATPSPHVTSTVGLAANSIAGGAPGPVAPPAAQVPANASAPALAGAGGSPAAPPARTASEPPPSAPLAASGGRQPVATSAPLMPAPTPMVGNGRAVSADSPANSGAPPVGVAPPAASAPRIAAPVAPTVGPAAAPTFGRPNSGGRAGQ